MLLDKALIERLRQPMYQTWSNIGYDIQQCIEECGGGEELTNEAAIESCIDANNLWFNGNDKEADSIILECCKDHGYHETLTFLCKHFKFA